MMEHHPARVPWWQEVAIAGASHLSDSELLTLLLGVRRSHASTSVAEALLHHPDGLIGLAGAVREGSRPNVPLRPRQRALLASAFELVARIGRSQRALRTELRTAAQVCAVVGAEMALLPHEELWCLPLDAHSRLIGRHHVVSVGDVDGCDAGPRNFFRHALMAGATSVLAAHNHPSGDPSPSGADRAVTLRLAAAGRSIDVPLVDHVVIGDAGRHCSLRALEPGLFR